FWELIQDEAESGVTVFVTTHFLEEADYCDWISFIDSGRLVADASPAELRRRFSSGYRVRVELLDEAQRRRLAALFAERRLTVESAASGLVLRVPELDAAVLRAVDEAVTLVPSAAVAVEQPEMTDVFRELMRHATTGASQEAA